MKHRKISIFKYLTGAMLIFISLASSNAQTKKVFAHYMVCNKSYGNGSVAGYKQDIQDAQNIGVDGFALNIGGWDANYQQNTQNLFQAATELGTDFKFFISIDRCCGLSDPDILTIIKAYINHPNHFKYNNNPVLSAWAGGGGTAERDWWNINILGPLKNSGYNVYFLPFLFTSDFDETPDYNKYLSNYNIWWNNLVNGYFYFGPAGLPVYTEPSILTSGEAAAKVFHDNGLTFMGSVSPYYWGEKQTTSGRRYYEYHGGEGIAAQWKSILEIQKPEWIELTTWNDFGEGTYLTPMDDINKYWPFAGHPQLGFYKTHKGFADLNKYYIDWYKSGIQPTITNDNIYFFYRTHSKDLTASNDPQGAVSWRFGDVNDEIHVTTILPAPAELRVITGGVTKTYNVGAGIVHTRIPFNNGTQSFELWRNGVRVVQQQGENILSAITEYDFNVYSGHAVSTSSTALPPTPTPTGASDLVVTNISMSPSNPLPGQLVTFRATLKNQGTLVTPSGTIVGVSFTVDNTSSVWSSSYSSLAAGDSMIATANGSVTGILTWPATSGSHTIEAFVDDVNRIAESNETNNKLSQTFIVPLPRVPDLILTNVSWSPSNPIPGQAVTFNATVKNQGTGPTPAGTIIGVLFTLDSVNYIWSDNVTSSLAAGASVNVTANGSPSGIATWTAIAGNHSVNAMVDDINRIQESNETNNKLVNALVIPVSSSGTGLNGQYFDNMDFTNLKLTRIDAKINFNWGSGAPVSTMGVDQFSVRWTGQVQPLHSETYSFYTNSDDGVRLWVNGQQIINNWTNHAPTENNGNINLLAGQKYDIRMEFYENTGGALATLLWSSRSQAKQVIPKSQLYNSSASARAGLLDEPITEIETSIYPNPSNGELNLIYNSLKKEEINIVINDSNSEVRLNLKLSADEGENHFVLDISRLLPGIYFVNIISPDKKTTKKIVVN